MGFVIGVFLSAVIAVGHAMPVDVTSTTNNPVTSVPKIPFSPSSITTSSSSLLPTNVSHVTSEAPFPNSIGSSSSTKAPVSSRSDSAPSAKPLNPLPHSGPSSTVRPSLTSSNVPPSHPDLPSSKPIDSLTAEKDTSSPAPSKAPNTTEKPSSNYAPLNPLSGGKLLQVTTQGPATTSKTLENVKNPSTGAKAGTGIATTLKSPLTDKGPTTAKPHSCCLENTSVTPPTETEASTDLSSEGKIIVFRGICGPDGCKLKGDIYDELPLFFK